MDKATLFEIRKAVKEQGNEISGFTILPSTSVRSLGRADVFEEAYYGYMSEILKTSVNGENFESETLYLMHIDGEVPVAWFVVDYIVNGVAEFKYQNILFISSDTQKKTWYLEAKQALRDMQG